MLKNPKQIRRRDNERHGGRDPGAGTRHSPPRIRIEQQEQRERRSQDHHEILRPPGEPKSDTEQDPKSQLAAAERGEKGEARQRPQRQLGDVVIEFGGAGVEVIHAVDDQHGSESADCADERARRKPHERERDNDRDLRQRVERVIGAEQAISDFGKKPR